MVLASALCFSTLTTFNRYVATGGVDVLTTLTIRFVIASVLLWGIAFARGPVTLPLPRALGFLIMGALFVLVSLGLFTSSRRIPIALTALLLYLYPAIVMLLSWLFLKERPNLSGVLALALALTGISLAIGFPAQRLDPLGVALGLASAFAYAGVMLLGSKLQKGVHPILSSAWILGISAALFLVIAVSSGNFHPSRALVAWPSILGMAIVGTVLSLFLLLASLSRISATEASIASTVEPISTGILGAVLLRESLKPIQVLGGILVLAAVVLLSMNQKRP